MSEIKGQLLGIIIVLMVFAAVGGTMVAVFGNFSKSVENTVSEVVNQEVSEGLAYTYSESESLPQGAPSQNDSITPGLGA